MFLPNGYRGAVTITATAVGGQISCIANFNSPTGMTTMPGDWSMSYNAFNK
jgi:hypothetical protein